MAQLVLVVNASTVLADGEVARAIPAFQTQIDRDFLPAWHGHGGVAMKLEFLSWSDYRSAAAAGRDRDAWIFFLNRHSADAGALGWHTQEDSKVYGRVFVGDCIHAGISWQSDFSHELLETGADANAQRAFRAADGKLYAIEICDAVESDDIAYKIGDVLVSDFVLPQYFGGSGKDFDFCKRLHSPCPGLTSGGYMSVSENGQWGQIEADRRDGLRGRRALRNGWRRLTRKRVGEPEVLFDLS